MKRNWLRAVPALAIGLTALALASPALAHDPNCTRSHSQQDVYADEYRSDGYGTDGYARPYGDDRPYAQYGYQQQPYSQEGYTQPYSQYGYTQPYSRYGHAQSYSQYGYRQRPYSPHYGNGYQGYGNRVVHEDHIRTTFNPFPLPHLDKRIIHHQHPSY